MKRSDAEPRKARPAIRQATARKFNFWTYNNSGSTNFKGGTVSKHIYLGETRLATVINDYRNVEDRTFGTEKNHIYFYHSDHLGSAQLVTDSRGDEYQRIEYTPYGETWVDVKIQGNKELAPLSYRFSAKELDEETGFYYFGARYLDPRFSRWISADPAMNTGEYFPVAPVDDEAKKHNGNLPGMGGIFNHINGNLFAYAGNNPIKYTDPDGEKTKWSAKEWIVMAGVDFRLGDTGITGMIGKAHVTFTNEETNESFNFTYDIVTVNSLGLNVFVGASGGFTYYEKEFDDDASQEEVIKSYEGIFANITCPQLSFFGGANFYGFSASGTVVLGVDKDKGFFGEDPWRGINVSVSFNLVSALLSPVSNPIPTYSLSFSIYKPSVDKDGKKTEWANFDEYFFKARLFSNQLKPSDLPRLAEDAAN